MSISETKFAALKNKLRELFELDKSDLDFGIYRIMAARNKEVTAFLDRELKETVREVLQEHGTGQSKQIQAELEKTIEGARIAGYDPDKAPRVLELREQLKSTAGGSVQELEADIYNHLLAFFSRYYDEGDFISKRYYKGDTYAIPYNGEEVTLHWANKDQYYIKSGEWHRDYSFLTGGFTVRFVVLDATQEASNNKESDNAKRRYILDEKTPVLVNDNELTLQFHFVVPSEQNKERLTHTEPTRIFGGKFDGAGDRKKGDEREQFCADSEMRALAAMSKPWRQRVQIADPTPNKPNRTILGKQLDSFTARNTFDYFIHKDLHGFLQRELDFYIKNEVFRLDDFESLDDRRLAASQGKLKAIRRVAGHIIQFLANIEDFQKRLWLKRKFVLETNWLVTVDRIPAKLRDIVATNAKQWEDWESLGFRPDVTKTPRDLFQGAAWGTRDYLDLNDKLVVNTRFFDASFKHTLCSSDEVRSGNASFHPAVTGVLVSSENFHALRLLSQAYRHTVSTIYIDPPYNTDGGPILYKNGYRASSWASMIADRLHEARPFLHPVVGVICATIDDFQQRELHFLLSREFGDSQLLGTVAIRSNPSGRPVPSGFAQSHEYAIFAGASTDGAIDLLPRSEEQSARYRETDDDGNYMWELFRKRGSNSESTARPSLYSPIVYCTQQNIIRLPEMSWDANRREWLLKEVPAQSELVFYPLDDNGVERTWRWNPEAIRNDPGMFCAKCRDEKWTVYYKFRPANEGVLPTTFWGDAKYSATEHGTGTLKKLFSEHDVFSYPKSIFATEDCISISGMKVPGSTCMDFFAGSGTTGHAVINLIRQDNQERHFVLVEMGAYFERVLLPRIAKVVFSPEWKDGAAVDFSGGMSSLIKYFSLESYEDALNNLPSSGRAVFSESDKNENHMLSYALDLELGPHLIDLDAFSDPWSFTLNCQLASDSRTQRRTVDLVETFNYLLGLRVHGYGNLERYDAEFHRQNHADGLGRLLVDGRLRMSAAGTFVFQRMEGELSDGTRVLVIWRKLTNEPEQDAAVLDAWVARHREDTKQRSEHRDYHRIYINGPITLPQPTQELRTVFPIEQTFKELMFADTEDV